MVFDIRKKIEYVRQQPEHVRMRYVIMCLAVSMAFIVGLWLLSVHENFQNAAGDVPKVIDGSKGLLPKEETPSFQDLLKDAVPLTIDSTEQKSGQELFEEMRTKENQNGEGL